MWQGLRAATELKTILNCRTHLTSPCAAGLRARLRLGDAPAFSAGWLELCNDPLQNLGDLANHALQLRVTRALLLRPQHFVFTVQLLKLVAQPRDLLLDQLHKLLCCL